jgi:hypothetical protein
MPRYEYKLVPAPEKATKHKGLKGAANFAATLEDVLNELGADGWHYLRIDTLPQQERSGLASKTTTYRNLLVFQRELPEPDPVDTPASVPERRLSPVLAERARPDPPPPLRRTRTTDPGPGDEGETDGEGEASLANLFADPDDRPDPEDTTR